MRHLPFSCTTMDNRNSMPAQRMDKMKSGSPLRPVSDSFKGVYAELSNYEQIITEMQSTQQDKHFKTEMNAIEIWFTQLNQSQRTAALYSLLLKSSAIEARFFTTVLNQLCSKHDSQKAIVAADWSCPPSVQSTLSPTLSPPSPPQQVAWPVSYEDEDEDQVVDLSLLTDIPLWFKTLRLHKYTPLFMNLKYQVIIEMDDQALIEIGVQALGARRKMLKEFKQVKLAMFKK